MLLVLFALIVVAVVVAAVAARNIGVPRAAVAAAGAVVLVVLLIAGMGLGVRGSGDGASTPPTPPTTRPAEAVLPSRTEVAPPDLPVIEMTATAPGAFAPDNVVGGIQPPSVVRVRARGFDAFESGSVEQCVSELGRLPTCTPPFPVQFGEDGRAEFQFGLHAFSPGGCRWGRPTCELRVRGSGSGRVGTAQTILVDAARRGRMTVEPDSGVVPGDVVNVSVTGFPAGGPATAMLCTPPSGYDPRRCGAAGGTALFTVDAAGTGQADLEVGATPLGTEGRRCGPRVPCVVAVVTAEGFSAAPAVPLGFSRGPGASYDPARVAVGLSIAALLAAVGIVLARRTDWRKPTEAATPDVDRADLETGLTLDQLFGTDEELDASDPIRF